MWRAARLLAVSVVLLGEAVGASSRLGEARPLARPPASEDLHLMLRSREETAPRSGVWRVRQRRTTWKAAQTAVIVVDMWDRHWCQSATERVGELAVAMNDVLEDARRRGVLIVHAPSGTVDAYAERPQRRRALSAAKHEPPADVHINEWCDLDPSREPPLPIDDSDGGCDKPCPGGRPCQEREAWSRQTPAIEIGPQDVISDSGQEIYNVLQDRGIENVLVMGVHINMCVLGRPFAIRQLANLGKNVALVRDLTDAMYNPERPPYVTHFRGTELVTEHIEKHWAPSILSSDLTGRPAFRFAEDKRTHIAFVIAEDEYEAHKTLPRFAERHLSEGGRYAFNVIQSDGDEVDGMEQIRDADLVVLYVRRRHLPQDQLAWLRRHLAAGKPLVALRTSSHAFETWTGFDREVLGGNYTGHYGNRPPASPSTWVQVDPAAADHPVVAGLPARAFEVASWLYKPRPLASDVTPLMHGRVGQEGAREPVAWIRRYGAARIFYTSLGHPRDFELEAVNHLLANAIEWAVDSDQEHK